jgi:hypothetical protein
MMSQVHMSYVIWNDPTQQTMPSIMRVGGDTPTDRLGPKLQFADRAPAPQGVIAIEAPDFTRARNGKGLSWTVIPNLGRTKGAVLALPQGRAETSAADGIRLEYDVTIEKAGPARTRGIRVGVSVDKGAVQTLTAALEPTGGEQDTPNKKQWARAVCDNVMVLAAELGSLDEGKHTIEIWRLDDNAVMQKLVLSTVAVPDSYLGP